MYKSINSRFKILLSLLILFFSSKIYAAEYMYQCQSDLIPEEAKGIYKCSSNGKMIYISPDNSTYNLFNFIGSEKNKISNLEACTFAASVNGLEYTDFDNHGNFYFAASGNYIRDDKLQSNVVFIFKFDPVKKSISFKAFDSNTLFHSMCVSEDGRWIFVDLQENEDRTNWVGYSRVYAVTSDFTKPVELIWKSSFDYPHINGTYNLCFDSNTKNLYFSENGWTAHDDSQIGSGLYILPPDENGNYKKENLQRKSVFLDYNVQRALWNSIKNDGTDYTYLLNCFKDWCGPNIDPSEIEFNLSYFKQRKLNGRSFSGLYKTGKKGEPLKEEEAIKVIVENKSLFLDFISNFNKSKGRSVNCVPLDVLCYKKGTNTPAWTYDSEFYKNYNITGLGLLYSNKEGVWGLFIQDDGTVSSAIYHVTDNKGHYLGTQENDLDRHQLQSIHKATKPIVFYENSFSFLEITNKNIYHYENNQLTEITSLIPVKSFYNKNDVILAAENYEKLKAEKAEQNKAETEAAAENQEKTGDLEIEANNQINQPETKNEFPKTVVKKSVVVADGTSDIYVEADKSDGWLTLTQNAEDIKELKKSAEEMSEKLEKSLLWKKWLLICSIVFLISTVILLILLVVNFSIRKKKQNLIKNDKKFIYDIQEKERGKISRDIHDSVIQDIRAIRIEAELIKPEEESQAHKDKVINLATDCVVKLRNICYNLTPAELTTHEQGDSTKIELISIIQSLVIQFIERTHVPCQLKIEENFDYPVLPKDISQNLFRIIQEALNNIEKHSYATDCQILIKNKIEDDKKYMLIYVSDDGIGCDMDQIMNKNKKNHFGIGNMIDRAELIGASIDFQSEQGQGMEVRIKLQVADMVQKADAGK